MDGEKERKINQIKVGFPRKPSTEEEEEEEN